MVQARLGTQHSKPREYHRVCVFNADGDDEILVFEWVEVQEAKRE